MMDLTPPRTRVSMKFVKNLGNYESLHLEISVEDSARQGEKVHDALDRVFAFVEEQLVEKMSEIEADINGKK